MWTLSRLEIRAPISRQDQPVARIELDHPVRGRVSDLARAPGALDAAYQAVSQIMDAPARVAGIDMQYIAADPDETGADGQGADVLVELEAEVDGERFPGRARARDILPACVGAYIDALNNALAVRRRREARANAAA